MLRARSSCQTKRRAGSGSFSIRVRESPATALMPFGSDRRHRGVAIQLDLEDLDDERVVRRRAFDVEWTDFAGPCAAGALVVVAGLARRLGSRRSHRA